jgi:regulator of replication initiation timing
LPKSDINYRIQVHAENFYSEKAKCSDDTVLFFKMELTPVCVMPFPIFYFEENSLNFCKDFEEVLNAMTSILNDNPNLQMEIIAYTDSLENNKLRRKRAKKVYKSLVKNGVSKNQLVFSDNQRENSLFILNEDSSNFVEIFPTESYIQSQPPEKQDELRELNRRVMFSIVRTDLIPEKKKKK